MKRNEKESLNGNNFGHYLLDFISDRVKIAGQSNFDEQSLLFQKIEIEKLKKQYPILQSYLDFYENSLNENRAGALLAASTDYDVTSISLI